MSANNGFTETAVEGSPVEATSDYDGTQAAYANHDQSHQVESALSEQAEVDEIKEKISKLEGEEENVNLKADEDLEPKDNEFSSKFAALSRREKQIRAKESALEEKLAAMEARLESLSAPKEEVKVASEPELPLEYRLKKDPLGTLSELGLSYEQLTNLALNDGKLTTEMQMDLMRQDLDKKYSSELDQLRSELADKEKAREEDKYNEVVTNFKSELTNFINDTDSYELIRANDAIETVYGVIEEHYRETGRIMSKDEAADQVEAYLEERVEQMLKLNKFKNKSRAQEAPQQPQPEQRTQVKEAPTLLNAHSTAASKTSRRLSRDESISSAASLLKWRE
jgi:hypothetical protein